MTDEGDLVIWTIYKRPADLPEHAFVVRGWVIRVGKTAPLPTYEAAETLDEARGKIPPGLFRLPAYPADDPVILESWV
jgi:hypothetical protein